MEKSGRNLFEYVSETFANSDLSDEIKNCMTEEIGYFMEHIIPE